MPADRFSKLSTCCRLMVADSATSRSRPPPPAQCSTIFERRRSRLSATLIPRRFISAPITWCWMATTVRNLELVEPLFAGESRETTLIHVLDQTCTGMGGRLLRQRLLQPSCNRPEIECRLDGGRGAGRQSDSPLRFEKNPEQHPGCGTPAGQGELRNSYPARDAGAGEIAGAATEAR